MSDIAISKKPRPKHLNLIQIRLPVPGIVSILHRISGAALFLMLPLLIYLFTTSLASPDGYAQARALARTPLVAVVLFGLVWAYMHHFCAGIRYLFLDLNKGIDLQPARMSAVAVLVVSLTLTAILGVTLW